MTPSPSRRRRRFGRDVDAAHDQHGGSVAFDDHRHRRLACLQPEQRLQQGVVRRASDVGRQRSAHELQCHCDLAATDGNHFASQSQRRGCGCSDRGLAGGIDHERRLFPWRVDPHEPRIIAVDPKVAFGQPVLSETRVPVDIIFDRYRAGDTMESLATDYRVTRDVIEDLVRKWFGSAAA